MDRLNGAGDPFLSHAFLDALEESGCCSAESGGLPQHVAVEDTAGELVAAMPLYLKSHSYGEYVFDHGVGRRVRARGRFLLPEAPMFGAVHAGDRQPPADCARPGPGPYAPAADFRRRAGLRTARRIVASHHLPHREAEWRDLGAAGFLQRTGEQFHWRNRGYGCFDDFLATLNSRKRKTIRRERAGVRAAGIDIEVLTGDALREEHWDAFHRFYIDTGQRKWGAPYLTARFSDCCTSALPTGWRW